MVRGRWSYSISSSNTKTIGQERALQFTYAFYGHDTAQFNLPALRQVYVLSQLPARHDSIILFKDGESSDTDGTNMEDMGPERFDHFTFQNELNLPVFDAFAYGVQKQSNDEPRFGSAVGDLLSADGQKYFEISSEMDRDTGKVTLFRKGAFDSLPSNPNIVLFELEQGTVEGAVLLPLQWTTPAN